MNRLVVRTWIIATFCFAFIYPAVAGQSVKLSDTPSGIMMLGQDTIGVTVRIDVGKIDFIPVSTPEGRFILAKIDGMARSFNIGEPNLPVANRLIAIPYGCELRAEVLDYEIEEISLVDLGLTDPIIPAQPPLSKSDDPADIPFEYNRSIYQLSGFYTLPLAQTEVIGSLRDMRLGRISIAPIEYSPTDNKLRVYKNVTVQVNYENPDWQETQAIGTKHYSPFFEPIYSRVLNYSGLRGGFRNDSLDLTKYPVKYLIISDRMFESQLQPFITWKIKKGFKVVTAYTDVIGTSNIVIKSYIDSVYNAGTPEDPAPSFVLFVGDAQQIPPFSGSAGSHITDLKFCEFTGDNLPDIYYGRFSAQNTTQLQPQIDKTLEYEQYLMPDPGYLGEATLVAGVDGNNADPYANGQINYGTNLYFNTAHGIEPHVWLYPASAGGGVAADIIQTINDGVGFYNYTAHCSHTGHSNPSFTTINIPGLTNYHKYLLAIGNCCLPNTFGTSYSSPCFGEAFLQVAEKGGIGYIGGTNSTYWDEDYWWGVGYGPIIGGGPTYEQTTLGAYDGVFHDHGEPVTRHYVTNAAIIFAGNLGVSEGGSKVPYYWEIYHLMGDPSVMTYLGMPSENNVIHDAIVLPIATSFIVQADPASYVGITHNGVLHGAGYIDASGSVEVALEPFATGGTADIIVTAQNRIPYISTIQIISPEGPFVVYDDHEVNDAAGNNDGVINCGEAISLGVQLINMGPDTAFEVVAVLSTEDTFVTITDNIEFYGTIPGDFGVLNLVDAFAFDVSENMPNNHNISFNLAVTGSERDTTWISGFIIEGHCYPAIAFSPGSIVDSLFHGDSTVDTLRVYNNGNALLEVSFSTTDSWLSVIAGQHDIASYDSLLLPITINSESLDYGDFTGYIDYISNDPLDPGGSVPVYLHIYSPDIYVPQISIEETVPPDSQLTIPLTIYNNGPGPLDYEIARLMFDGKGAAGETAIRTPIGNRPADPEKSNASETEPFFTGVNKSSGGPDLWGHSWVDSDDAEGPVFGWVDISIVGTLVDSMDDDDTTAAIPIGFDFPFYENFYSQLNISSNGILTFGGGSIIRTNTSFPDTALPNNMIAMWWDDLDPSQGGQIYYYSDVDNERFIVSFVEIPNCFSSTGTGSLTFQTILYSNGRIILQYGVMDPGSDSDSLSGATIGIENSVGDDGLDVVYNAEYVHENLAILFIAAGWLSVEPASGIIDPFSDDIVNVNFDATELTVEEYHGQLTIYSNDPDTPSLDIPVTMIVEALTPPEAPSLISPADGAVDVPQPVTLDWDSVSNADMYQMQLDSTPTFGEKVVDTSIVVSQCAVSGLKEGATYHWRVRAHNSVDWGDWSQVRSFTTEITWICGDVNDDGNINIFDITHLISYLYQSGPPPVVPNTADVNNDGDVNIFDITYLIAYLYESGPLLDCPVY